MDTDNDDEHVTSWLDYQLICAKRAKKVDALPAPTWDDTDEVLVWAKRRYQLMQEARVRMAETASSLAALTIQELNDMPRHPRPK